MNATKWAKALLEIRKGKTVTCPVCGKADIVAEYKKVGPDDGMVVLRCPSCKNGLHFSHQKSL